MDGLYPPTALYLVLAVAVAVTARVTTESTEKLFRIKSWKKWLLHGCRVVSSTLLHVLATLAQRLVAGSVRPYQHDHSHGDADVTGDSGWLDILHCHPSTTPDGHRPEVQR